MKAIPFLLLLRMPVRNLALTPYVHLSHVCKNLGTDEADAQIELKHAIAVGNLDAQRVANEKLVFTPNY